MTDSPEINLDVELYSANIMKADLERAAVQLERAAADLRGVKADVDRLADSSTGSYLDVAIEAQRIVDRGATNTDVWRVAKSGGVADLGRAQKAREK